MKKGISIILSIMVILAMCIPATAFAEETIVNVSTANELRDAVNNAGNDVEVTITLTKSINLGTSVLEIPKGKTIEIKGTTGKEKLTVSLSSYYAAQYNITGKEAIALMQVSGELILKNITLDAENHMRTLAVNSGGTVNLDSGSVITGGQLGQKANGDNYGSGVVLFGNFTNRAVLNINSGATVTGNSAYGNAQITGIGIGIFKYGTVNMNGGTVSNNKDLTTGNYRFYSMGGGIGTYGIGAEVNIAGGNISGNSAKIGGGGLYLESGVANISGGTISGNTTDCSGAGVFNENCVTKMSGGTIKNNIASSDEPYTEWSAGGGLYVEGSAGSDSFKGSFSMSGGTISDNQAKTLVKSNPNDTQTGQGGGVKVQGVFNMSGGTVTGNSATTTKGLKSTEGSGGGVSVAGGRYPGTFNMTGGIILGNTASNKGAGVFVNNKGTETNRSYPDSNAYAYDGTGTFSISGELTLKDAYLMKDCTMTIANDINSKSEITLDTAVTTIGAVVARAGDNHSVSSVDARTMKTTSEKSIYEAKDNSVVIGQEKTDEYISISGANVTGIDEAYTYKGVAIKPTPIVTITINDSVKILTEGTDYTLSYYDNINTKVVSEKDSVVRVIGNGEYSGSVDKKFEIKPKEITSDMISNISDRIFTDSPVTPEVKIYNDGIQLEKGNDYEVSYSNNDIVGTAIVNIKGKGNYSGTSSKDFQIISNEGKNIAKTADDIKDFIAKATTDATDTTDIYLDKDIAIIDQITVPEGKKIKIIGNGDNLTLKKNSTASVANLFNVEGELELENVTLSGDNSSENNSGRMVQVAAKGKLMLGSESVITGGYAQNGAGVNNAGELILNGGEITKNNGITTTVGSGIFALGAGVYNTGTVTINSGTINKNIGGQGAGIYNNKTGTVNMYGGNITTNRVTNYGGGIYNEGTYNLEGGKISENTADRGNQNDVIGVGGGVYNVGTFSMAGGSVGNNTSSEQGGGIYTNNKLKMTGGSINNNETVGVNTKKSSNCGGGVYIADGTFEMTGGSVNENKANSKIKTSSDYGNMGCGGGVYVSNTGITSATFDLAGGTVSNNMAAGLMNNGVNGQGGGIYVMGGENPATLNMTGGMVTGNNATEEGDGIYFGNKEIYYQNRETVSNEGNSKFYLKGSAEVKDNYDDDIYLTYGTSAELTGALTGSDKSIGVSAGVNYDDDNDYVVAKGSEAYEMTSEDSAKIIASKDPRTVTYDLNNKNAYLKTIDIDGYKISLSGEKFDYTGKEIKPAITVTDSNGKKLTEGKDYAVDYEGTGIAKKLINVGEKTAKVTGIGYYSGNLSSSYSINRVVIDKAKISMADKVYTGKALTPNPAAISYNGIKLLKGTDYTATYINNVKAGCATVTFEGRGNFEGKKKTATFKIYPSKGAIKKVLRGKKNFKVSIKNQKVQSVSGYQIGYEKKGGKWKYIKTSATSKSIKKLSSKKYYYVKVRAYKKISGKNYYGSWSASKKVKTK